MTDNIFHGLMGTMSEYVSLRKGETKFTLNIEKV